MLSLQARRVFKPYLTRAQRYAIMVAHRRCGKTVACVQDLIIRATSLKLQPGWGPGRYAYVAPLYSQAKEIAWDYLRRFAEPVMVDANVAELHVTLLNGARIRLHGADNPDRLRGGYLDGCILDEYADMRPSVLGEVVRPMLADRGGWLTAIGTPKGKNEFYRLWEAAQNDPRWMSQMLRASETGLLNDEELKDASRDMTLEQYQQEFECSFEAAIRGAFYLREMSAVEREGRILPLLQDPLEPVYTAWDLGLGSNMAVWAFQLARDGDRARLNIIGCLNDPTWGFREYIHECNRRGWRGKDFVPHDIKVKDFIEIGRTRVEYMFQQGRKPELVANNSVDDGINAVKMTLPYCWFDSTDPAVLQGVEALRQYRQEWDERRKEYSAAPRHDWASHFADAFRYLAWGWRALEAEAAPPPPIEFPSLNQITMDQYMGVADAPQRDRRL